MNIFSRKNNRKNKDFFKGTITFKSFRYMGIMGTEVTAYKITDEKKTPNEDLCIIIIKNQT